MKTIFGCSALFLMVFGLFQFRPLTQKVETETAKPKFSAFLAEFKPQRLPIAFSETDVRHSFTAMFNEERNSKSGRNFLSGSYSVFIPDLRVATFSRMPTQPAEAVAQFQLADQQIGLIYKRAMPFGNAESYTLAVMSAKGKLIRSIDLGYSDQFTAQLWAIQPSGKINKQRYEIVWEKTEEEVDYDFSKNTIVKFSAKAQPLVCNLYGDPSLCSQ